MHVVLVGPPGAGKGTQARGLSATLAVPHISTGDLLRALAGASTELGRELAGILSTGALVPDTITNEIVRRRLSEPDARAGSLLDGYPRNRTQARALDTALAAHGRELDRVLELVLDDEIALTRLLSRGRGDDTEAVIRHRQHLYRTQTEPVLEHYAGRVVTIDADGTVEQVAERALRALREE
ncbi:adenylate kinase [Nocardia sp. NPDC005978]|uniref:adenylate kinase n=1 Tax=Nocardia sp. NPDC005978 TaxID=3156725 RepID=UPI0033B85D09